MTFHRLLGHPRKQASRESAERSGIVLTDMWKTCIGYSTAKAHRETVAQSTVNKSAVTRGQGRINLAADIKLPNSVTTANEGGVCQHAGVVWDPD